MKKYNGVIKPLLVACALAFASVPVQATVVTFDSTAVAGAGGTTAAFTFDELTFRSINGTSISLTDTGDGILGGPLDTFVETGGVFQTQFFLGGVVVPLITSQLNSAYEIFATFTPPQQLSGTAGIVGGNLVATFNPLTTNATIWYDAVVNGVLNLGSSNIGQLSLGTGSCVLTPTGTGGGFPEGSCGIDFAFDRASVTDAGVWTVGGTDIGLLNASMSLDVDVDSVSPAFALAYPGGAGSTQTAGVVHDGSAVIQVSEPGLLALLGVGLVGIGVVRRRR